MDASLRRYEKHGRISRQLQSLPTASRQSMELEATQLQENFYGSFARHLRGLQPVKSFSMSSQELLGSQKSYGRKGMQL